MTPAIDLWHDAPPAERPALFRTLAPGFRPILGGLALAAAVHGTGGQPLEDWFATQLRQRAAFEDDPAPLEALAARTREDAGDYRDLVAHTHSVLRAARRFRDALAIAEVLEPR